MPFRESGFDEERGLLDDADRFTGFGEAPRARAEAACRTPVAQERPALEADDQQLRALARHFDVARAAAFDRLDRRFARHRREASGDRDLLAAQGLRRGQLPGARRGVGHGRAGLLHDVFDEALAGIEGQQGVSCSAVTAHQVVEHVSSSPGQGNA